MQENLPEQIDAEITRKYRETSCAFFGTQKSKVHSPNERVIKLDDGTDIPIEDAFEIFRSISFDDTVESKYLSSQTLRRNQNLRVNII